MTHLMHKPAAFLLSLVVIVIQVIPTACSAQGLEREKVIAAMRQAATYYREKVASHGGYVYHYSPDLSRRWGEGEATVDQIWVQPPGTPTVGLAYLKAFEATADPYYLEAARDAAEALVHGQITTGGWTNCIDFNPRGERVANYRDGRGKGRTTSSLDDGQTSTALRFLIRMDQALEFKNEAIHEATLLGLNSLLDAQYPNGGFPQIWDGTQTPDPPVVKANYPKHDWRTEGRVKDYWHMYTLNDNVPGYVTETLIAAHEVYADERYLAAVKKLGDFLVLAQMPNPQPGWAQQYNYDMQPIWARKFEPPGVSGDETQETIETLIRICQVTGDDKYLAPIPTALAWLRRSALTEGRVARYYELRSNKPLYMSREGDNYSLTYDDSKLPSHYGWKTDSKIPQLTLKYNEVKQGERSRRSPDEDESLPYEAQEIVKALDEQGRWVDRYDGEMLVGQPKFKRGEEFISSGTFSANLERLAEYVKSTKN